MTGAEQGRGLVLFVLYLVAFPYLTALIQRLWMIQGEIAAAEGSLVYYAALLVITLLVFRPFLRRELDALLGHIPQSLSALLIGLALWMALRIFVGRIPLPLENPLPFQWRQEYIFAPRITLVLVLLFIPIVEEIFFRGLVFNLLRQRSRILAYVLSALLFALASTWRYALDLREGRYLMNALEYLPAGFALAWCNEKGESVFPAIALRIAINVVILLLALG